MDPEQCKKLFLSSQKMVWDVHLGYRIRIFSIRIRIPDPGVKKAQDLGSGSITLFLNRIPILLALLESDPAEINEEKKNWEHFHL
jgi:hypothetical protein